VRWRPTFFSYVLSSLGGMFHYCFEYWVALHGKSAIYRVSVCFTLFYFTYPSTTPLLEGGVCSTPHSGCFVP